MPAGYGLAMLVCLLCEATRICAAPQATLAKPLSESVTGKRATATIANSANSLIFLLFIFNTESALNIGGQARTNLTNLRTFSDA